jgi:glycosyltransferase involved in cell wall biosynthesis
MQSLFSRLRRRPLVSLVLCTKNGMPFVRDALASVERQTYEPIELVVQDATSTDGTLEAVREAKVAYKRVVSEPDGGIGDAYNRAVTRCSGTIVGTIDADNLLEADAVVRAVATFRAHPDAAAVYGAARMIDESGTEVGKLVPAEFDVGALLRCELVPPFAQSFFSRRVCGAELRFDPRRKTCADFDLWLRLSHLEIARSTAVFGSVRLSGKSMTRDPANYAQFCADKVAALDCHIARNPRIAVERDTAVAGIYGWAAESLFELEGESARYRAALERACALAPEHPRVAALRERADAAETYGQPFGPPRR